jgi:hypothetical protein
MARIVRTTDDDYRIIVANGGTIYLDTTGAKYDGTGKVVVRGDLEVKGDTTTVESTISSISDNILLLSAGNPGPGLPASLDRPYSSGIEISRGEDQFGNAIGNARWVYDDNISWALGGNTGKGSWVATQGDIGFETVLPLRTDGIIASGSLYITVTGIAGTISVTGTNDYEERIWNYVAGEITPDPLTGNITKDDDNIPNTKAVKDLVDYSIATVEIDKIAEDNSSITINDKNNTIALIYEVGARTIVQTTGSHGYEVGDTIVIQGVDTSPSDAIINGLNGSWTVTEVPASNRIEFNRSSTGGDETAYITNSGRAVTDPNLNPTRIIVTVEGDEIVNFYSNRVELADVQILGTEISTYNSNDDLVLSAPGSGVVRVKDTIELTKTPGDDEGLVFDPLSPVEGIKLYSKTPSTGATGLFFVNEEDRRDEIISKNRALLYGMLF